MSQRADRKMRQLYRRDFHELAEAMAKESQAFLKPKPKWAPERVWIFFLGFFVRIKK